MAYLYEIKNQWYLIKNPSTDQMSFENLIYDRSSILLNSAHTFTIHWKEKSWIPLTP